jgi:nitroimidazol reductase NimA-like FMN-containing flavoprotein (pyridoxamine 5'-phosphate oxidase superfamily)
MLPGNPLKESLMPAKLTKEEAHEFLDSRPGWLMFTSVCKDGYPHTLPIGYFRQGDDIYIGGRTGTQRLRNVGRNPKVSALVESGKTMQDIKGLMIQGDAEIVSDPEAVLPVLRESARRRGAPDDKLPSEAPPGIAYIRIKPTKYISWDYSRQ